MTLADALRPLLAKAIAAHYPLEFPRGAYEDPAALLIMATEALYAYYLGLDGTVYELDMDRAFGRLDPIDDRARIREVYAKAIEFHPELGDLLVGP